jgi:hypothetical protein
MKDGVVCCVPSIPEISDPENCSLVSNSHEWVIVETEPYGSDGILTRSRCSKCGLGRLLLYYDIPRPAKELPQLVPSA